MGKERVQSMIEYLYAFKHVPLWFWAMGAAGNIATVLIFLSDSCCFQRSIGEPGWGNARPGPSANIPDQPMAGQKNESAG